MKKAHMAAIVALSLIVGCKSTPVPPGTESVIVTHLDPQRVLQNGDVDGLSVSKVGTTKRVRIQVNPRGNTVPDSAVGVDFSIDQRTAVAMNSPQRATARRLSGTPTTLSVFAVDIPGSEDIQRCHWFHYRWSFRYFLPGETGTARGFYASVVKPFQLLSTQSPGSDIPESPCPPVP